MKVNKTNRVALRLDDNELIKLKSIDKNLSKAVRKCIEQYEVKVNGADDRTGR